MAPYKLSPVRWEAALFHPRLGAPPQPLFFTPPEPRPVPPRLVPPAVVERGMNYSKGFMDFHPKARIKIWSCLSYKCRVRSTAVLQDRGILAPARPRRAPQGFCSEPPSSEFGTYKTVKARFWHWRSDKKKSFVLVVPCSLGRRVRDSPYCTRTASGARRAHNLLSVSRPSPPRFLVRPHAGRPTIQVDTLGPRYKSVNFAAQKLPGTPNLRAQVT